MCRLPWKLQMQMCLDTSMANARGDLSGPLLWLALSVVFNTIYFLLLLLLVLIVHIQNYNRLITLTSLMIEWKRLEWHCYKVRQCAEPPWRCQTQCNCDIQGPVQCAERSCLRRPAWPWVARHNKTTQTSATLNCADPWMDRTETGLSMYENHVSAGLSKESETGLKLSEIVGK